MYTYVFVYVYVHEWVIYSAFTFSGFSTLDVLLKFLVIVSSTGIVKNTNLGSLEYNSKIKSMSFDRVFL